MTTRVLNGVLCVATLLFTAGALAGRDTPEFPQCSCSCCEAELHGHGPMDSTLQCAKIPNGDDRFLSKFRAARVGCDQYCRPHATDTVLISTDGPQVDTERFCFFECAPEQDKAGAGCRRLDRKEEKEVEEPSGNGRETTFALPKITKPAAAALDAVLIMRAKAAAAESGRRAASNLAMGGAPWSSVKAPAPEIGTRAELEAKTAAALRSKAEESTAAVKEIQENNQKVTPALISSVEASTEAARAALAGQKVIEDLRDQALKVAKQAADDEIAGTIKAMKKAAHDKAKVEATKRANTLQSKMLAEAPKTGKAAMAPYNDALARAAATAGEYTKRGDGLSGASVGLQLQAGLMLGEANQLTSLGEVAKAQKKMQQAHQTMNLALALSGQANGFYAAGQSIMGTLGAYAAEGVQADYHAQYMLNPDLPPPAPPMV